MSDHQRTIEFLRDFRASGVQVVSDEVREAAAAYASLCATANDRLRQCAMLLQRGLRAEAVHAAEAPPNLLDLVAALDLPDAEGWVEMCQRNDMPVPPPLQMDRAAQLNDAYGQDQPLQQLYATHRRLALAKGPLADRLDVMRQLAAADPGPFWEKDIRTFEAARFKELRVGFAVAAKERDVPAFKSLAAEVLQVPWYETVPPDLASMAREIDTRAQQAEATSQVTELLSKLRSAYAAKSLPDCSALLEQLKDQSATLGVASLNDDAAADIRAAAAWVQQQNQSLARRKAHTDACDALADALNAEAKDRDLAVAYNAIVALGTKPVPPELQARYDARLKARAKAARFRNIAIVAGIAALLALAFGVFYWQTQQGIAREWARRIEKAVADRNVDLAKQLVSEQESLAPGASNDPQVAAAKKSATVLAEQVERDRDWVKGMTTIFAAASDKATKALADGSPDDWWTASLSADEALGSWGKPQDAKRMDPRNQVAAAAERLQKERESLRARYASWLVAQIDAASKKAGVLVVAPRASDIATAEAALAAAEKDLSVIIPQLDRGGDAAKAAADAVGPRLAAIRDAIRRARDEHDARLAIHESAGSVAAARQALQQFASRFPQSSVSPDFTKAAATLDLYESVDRYSALMTPFAAAPAPPNEKVARQRLDTLRQFIGDNPQSPLPQSAAGYIDYLQQAAAAMSIPNAWQTEMGDILTSPLMSELSYLEVNDKSRYYVLGDPAVQRQGVGTRVRCIFDSIDPQNLARKKTVTLLAPKNLVSEKPVLLPHALFVREMAEQMKTVDDRSWDTWGIDQVDKLIANTAIDPVVRAILLRDLLRATSRVDGWAIGDLYDRAIADLERQRLDNIVWYDQTNPVPAVTMDSLKSIIGKIPRGDVARKLVAERRASLFSGLKPPFVGTAMLLKDDAGKWKVATAAGTASATSAFAVKPPDGAASGMPAVSNSALPSAAPDAPPAPPPVSTSQPATLPVAPAVVTAPLPSAAARLVKVATHNGETWTIDEAAVRDLPEGTLVFLSR
ncbi:hypothetical protein [Humisphaera borealis]|uniref:Uncharacterized protein n=1 Tax=Humisphaera borealis TaxID=2807512 RepID=A0A7M2WR09_9BACT|nr:hypothetical protein [Humisphaera borealis]QOV87995.1 hypothetical protein IPV69_17195 [Humisphaera borealis]